MAYKEQVIDCYDDLFSLMPEMGLEMEKIGSECAQPDYCFTEYLDDHYKNEEIAVDICQSVTEIKESSSSLQFKVIPYVKDAACLFHKGAYHTFPQSYAKILRFIDENGYQINGNIREVYIDGVWRIKRMKKNGYRKYKFLFVRKYVFKDYFYLRIKTICYERLYMIDRIYGNRSFLI